MRRVVVDGLNEFDDSREQVVLVLSENPAGGEDPGVPPVRACGNQPQLVCDGIFGEGGVGAVAVLAAALQLEPDPLVRFGDLRTMVL